MKLIISSTKARLNHQEDIDAFNVKKIFLAKTQSIPWIDTSIGAKIEKVIS